MGQAVDRLTDTTLTFWAHRSQDRLTEPMPRTPTVVLLLLAACARAETGRDAPGDTLGPAVSKPSPQVEAAAPRGASAQRLTSSAAEKEIDGEARAVIAALAAHDMASVATHVDPTKGLRFSP